ncbi:MAG: COQ9 family protein [Gemmobacter sp.]|jgi:ubiquinone biosynthesis protein COQ9|nr:COQ9 family protein [Gemmobacter sp.]
MTDDSEVYAIQAAVLDAALAHVPFDGWSEAVLRTALADSGVEPALGPALFPRGALDLALAFHRRGDALMAERLAVMVPAARFRNRVTAAVMARLEVVEDKELVRRGAAFFALPQNMTEGAQALWETADAVLRALGDGSRDINWYSKRATIAAVYSATLLYWLGDQSGAHQATRDFLDRRITEVMGFEKLKASVRANPLGRALSGLLGGIRAPRVPCDLPGSLRTTETPGVFQATETNDSEMLKDRV